MRLTAILAQAGGGGAGGQTQADSQPPISITQFANRFNHLAQCVIHITQSIFHNRYYHFWECSYINGLADCESRCVILLNEFVIFGGLRLYDLLHGNRHDRTIKDCRLDSLQFL